MSGRQRRRGRHRLGGMRLRFPELLDENEVTAWRLSQMTGIPETTMYRFRRTNGRMTFISGHVVEAIAKALGIGIVDILELEGTARRVRRKRKR